MAKNNKQAANQDGNSTKKATKKKKKVQVHKEREVTPFRQPGNYKDGVLYVSLKQFDHSYIC